MKFIVNATPLISLGLLNRLSLLPSIFDEVLTPPAVYNEVVKQGEERPAAAAWFKAKISAAQDNPQSLTGRQESDAR